MGEYCSCGALLPEDARFCHKCGKPQRAEDLQPVDVQPAAAPIPAAAPAVEAPSAAINFHNRLAVRIAFLAAGLVTLFGIVPLPVILAGLLRFVLLAAGGFWAVYLYARRSGQHLSVGNGARMGWLTGVFTFVIMTVIFTITMVTVSADGGIRELFHKAMAGSAGAEILDQWLQSDAGLAAFIIGSLFFSFVTSTFIAVIGGALGAKVLEKE